MQRRIQKLTGVMHSFKLVFWSFCYLKFRNSSQSSSCRKLLLLRTVQYEFIVNWIYSEKRNLNSDLIESGDDVVELCSITVELALVANCFKCDAIQGVNNLSLCWYCVTECDILHACIACLLSTKTCGLWVYHRRLRWSCIVTFCGSYTLEKFPKEVFWQCINV